MYLFYLFIVLALFGLQEKLIIKLKKKEKSAFPSFFKVSIKSPNNLHPLLCGVFFIHNL